MSKEKWVFPASTLVRVKDGDTFVARVSRTSDFGFHMVTEQSSVQNFRLNRIACAPLKSDNGRAAASLARSLLEAGPFTLTSVGPYKYGDEWMAEVVLSDGRNLSDTLVEWGFAAYWDGSGKQPLP